MIQFDNINETVLLERDTGDMVDPFLIPTHFQMVMIKQFLNYFGWIELWALCQQTVFVVLIRAKGYPLPCKERFQTKQNIQSRMQLVSICLQY